MVGNIVLLADAPLTFREFVTHEEVPLATIFREVLEFLGGRADAIVLSRWRELAQAPIEPDEDEGY